MGCAVRVDGDRVVAAAARLAVVAQELTAAGEAMARVLQGVADSTAAAPLAGAATTAARQWRSGMGEVAAHGDQLARATAPACYVRWGRSWTASAPVPS